MKVKFAKSLMAIAIAATMTSGLAGCGGDSGAKDEPAKTEEAADSGDAEAADDGAEADDTASDSGAAGEQKEVYFFHRWPSEPKFSFFNQVVEDFEAANPDIKIKMDQVQNDSYKEKIKVLVGSNSMPDVFCSWSGSFAESLVESGKIKALNDIIDADTEWSSQIIESQWDPFTVDGKIYGVPVSMDGKAFFYNKTVFDELGLTAPTTYDEFITTLDKLKEGGYERPISEGFSGQWAISHYLGTMNQKMIDPAVFEKDYNPATGEFTDPGYLEVMKNFLSLSDYMTEAPASYDHTFSREAFIAGEYPVTYLQFAEIKYLVDGCDFEFAFFNWPQFADGKGDAGEVTGAPEGFMMSDISTVPDEAERLLKYLSSQEVGFGYTRDTGEISCIKGAVTSENAAQATLDAVDLIMESSGSALWLDNAVHPTIAEAYMASGQLMLTGDKTPEDVMADVQAAAKEVRESQ